MSKKSATVNVSSEASVPPLTPTPIPAAPVELAPPAHTLGLVGALSFPVVATLPADQLKRLVDDFLSSKSQITRDGYRDDLKHFAAFLDVRGVDEAATLLLSRGHGPANALAISYKSSMLDPGRKPKPLAPATVCRRLAAVRSLVDFANTIGLVPWTLRVKNPESQPYRDTTGPMIEEIQKLLDKAGERNDATGRRDVAIIRLGFDLALRRAEIAKIDVEHVDPQKSRVSILGKGRREPVWVALPPETLDAVNAWLDARGRGPGPLFTNFDHRPSKRGRRLSGCAIRKIVTEIGEAAGVDVTVHGLRHSSITVALEQSGDLRRAQAHSRHRSLRALQVYDDNRRNLGGEAAAEIAKTVKHRKPNSRP